MRCEDLVAIWFKDGSFMVIRSSELYIWQTQQDFDFWESVK